jgi:hypothetical protein
MRIDVHLKRCLTKFLQIFNRLKFICDIDNKLIFVNYFLSHLLHFRTCVPKCNFNKSLHQLHFRTQVRKCNLVVSLHFRTCVRNKCVRKCNEPLLGGPFYCYSQF